MRAEAAGHHAQRSRNEHADPVAEVRLGPILEVATTIVSPCRQAEAARGANDEDRECESRDCPLRAT
jgi:hypothetical protein